MCFFPFLFFFGRHVFFHEQSVFLEITEWESLVPMLLSSTGRVYFQSHSRILYASMLVMAWLDSSHNEWLETRVRVISTKYSKVVDARLCFYVIIGRNSQHYITWCKTGLRSGKSNSKLRLRLQHTEVFDSGYKIICSVKTENHCFISTIVPLHNNRWHIAK